MIKENPNDKILRNENYHNRWLKKFIKNSQELLKIYKKNKNGNGKD
jgi:transposase-like protein